MKDLKIVNKDYRFVYHKEHDYRTQKVSFYF